MSDKQNQEIKMSIIQQKLEDGVREIYKSGKYQEYITAMSKFPSYSVNNCILIASQRPDASLVCGFKTWQSEFNRTVNKGEHGIMIIAPVRGKQKVLEEVYDENNKAVVDENGKQVMEEVEIQYKTFRPVYVFDVSQTSGEPVPELSTILDDTVSGFRELKAALEEVSPVTVSYEHIKDGANGYYSPNSQKIVIEESLPQLQMIKTMIHEITHATLGHGTKEDKWDRKTKEVQAESVAYWVSQLLGLDTAEYSFGYITGWSRDKKVSELKENLELIKNTAQKLSEDIYDKLSEIKSRELPMVSEEKKSYNTAHHKKR